MYNGIGLATARGSGTNGYVQRNWAAIKKVKDQTSFKTDEELAKIDSAANRQPNQELLDHDRKRKIELKCIELEQSLEDQGLSQDEIVKKINIFRQTLLGKQKSTTEYDECGRPVLFFERNNYKFSVRDSHQLADEQLKKNARLRDAFGISEFFIEGSSLDPERKIKEAALAQLKALQVDQALAQTQMNEDTSTNKDSSIANELQSKSPKHKKRKKKKSKSHKSDKEKGSEKKKSKKHRRNHNSSSEDSPRTDESKANKNLSQVKSKYDDDKYEDNHKKHKKDNDKTLKNDTKEIEFKYKSDQEDYRKKDSEPENSKSLKKGKITEEFNKLKCKDIFYDSKKQENSPRHKTLIKERDRDRERDYDKYSQKQHTNRDDSKSSKEKYHKTDSKYNSRKRNSRSPIKELKKKSFKPDKLTCIPVDSDSDESCYTPPPKGVNAKLSQSKTDEEKNLKSTKYTFSLRENSEDRSVVNKSNGCTDDLKSALKNSENQHNKSESHKKNNRIDQIFLDSTTSEEGGLEDDIDLNIIKEITTEKIKKVFELHEKQEQALLHLKQKLMEKKRKVRTSSSSSESSDEPVKKKSVKRRRVKDSSSSNSDENTRKKSKRSRSSSSSSSASDTSVDHHKSLKRSKDKKYSKKKSSLSRRRTKDSTSRSRSRSVSVSSNERLRKKPVSSSEDSSPRRKHKSSKRKRSSWRQRSSSDSSISSRSSPSYSSYNNKRCYSLSRSRSTCSSSSSHYSRSSSSSRDSSSSGSSRSSKSRSASIPRRRGSPSFLDRRRITSARKRPIPYTRLTPFSTNSDTDSVISVHDSPIAESH
ncbi:PREDICTED: serine/arginine repetitive matrix protein 2-like isoform X2 [Diuraphis noxia]|uniref:serine/arginine repetitive matrix protein 2-like isoform X2 n=1 Tax=Diuraphis noxia TaxID=143948 RepID=UPI000763921E|nr:PREDICTED: serine/arginine repetitive matrix protein 2-like isoform X2 [Diuraphis noxia]